MIPEKDIDFGKKTRYIYLACCILGNTLTLYARSIFYAQNTYSFEGCETTKFDKPWFATLVMSLGMSMATILYKLLLIFSKEPPISFSKVSFSMYLHAFLPAVFDITISVLNSIALLLIGSTLTTFIRIMNVFFATLLRLVWLKEKILPYSWVSLAIIIVGVIFVSASIWEDEMGKVHVNTKFIVATVLQLLVQLAFAAKAIREEQLLHSNDIHPIWLCGIEGIYESIMILFIVDPIVNFIPKKMGQGLSENLCAAVMMVIHSPTLIGCFVAYLFIACFFNCSVMGVEYSSSALHFIVCENFVTCISWVIDLLIKYPMKGSMFGLSDKSYGTEWNSLSFLRLIGVVIIIIGSMLYIKLIKLPCFTYEESNVKIIEIPDLSAPGNEEAEAADE